MAANQVDSGSEACILPVQVPPAVQIFFRFTKTSWLPFRDWIVEKLEGYVVEHGNLEGKDTD
jgi:hypothetical protein